MCIFSNLPGVAREQKKMLYKIFRYQYYCKFQLSFTTEGLNPRLTTTPMKTTTTYSLLITLLIFLLLTIGCSKKNSTIYTTDKSVYTIAVLSDIHYMDPSLLNDTSSYAFKQYMKTDGKLLAESDAIMQEIIFELIHANPRPDLLLVAGDLTKDGELICHQSVARYFSQLISAGIKVRVTDGNHDINSQQPYRYIDSNKYIVANIDPDQFKALYYDCGYRDALSIDPNSLSYLSEPLPGLWLLTIDACKYWNGIPFKDMTGGRIKPETMTWIQERLAEAHRKGKMVFGMMHHGLLNHFDGEDSLFKGFVVDSSAAVSQTLMNSGLRIMFTGHFHATDIVKKTAGTEFIYDIETGSPLVYPCAYRRITYIKDSALIISTDSVTHTSYPIPWGETFLHYAKYKTQRNMDSLVTIDYSSALQCPYKIARIFSPRIRNAWMAHMAGDERLFDTRELDSIDTTIVRLGKKQFSWLRPLCLTLWNDLPPTDKSLMICLKSGASFK